MPIPFYNEITHHNGTTMWVHPQFSDPLEDAKTRLEAAEKALLQEQTTAEENIVSTKSQLAVAQQTQDAAKNRLERVKLVTNAVCQGCFEVLPALGKNLEDNVLKSCQGESKCACCGFSLLMSVSYGAIKMPPNGKNSALKVAELALSKAEDAIADPYPKRHIPNVNKNRKIFGLTPRHDSSNVPDKLALDRHKGPMPTCIHSNPRGLSPISPDRMPSKQSFVAAASKSAREAGRHANELRTVLVAWIQHVNQQKEELQKVQQMVSSIERQMENRDHFSEDECRVCRDRDVQVALQCGHRFCRQCSWELRTCPMCRAAILQRLELFQYEHR